MGTGTGGIRPEPIGTIEREASMKRSLVLLLAVAAMVLAMIAPAGAITDGTPAPDSTYGHVGELLFFVPSEADSRFVDPGSWFTCSGTLLSKTVVATAGHCTFDIGHYGVDGHGTGGTDVWVNFSEEPDFSILPPSSGFIPYGNPARYLAWEAALDVDKNWVRGTAYHHPQYDDLAFFLHDAGVIVLGSPVDQPASGFGELPGVGYLDQFLSQRKNDHRFTPVGYGLRFIRPTKIEYGDTRQMADVMLVNLKGTFGVPEGTSVVFSNNRGKAHLGGTCFGDSGGPIFDEDTNTIVAVTSFGMNGNCAGTGSGYRIDQTDDLEFFNSYLGS